MTYEFWIEAEKFLYDSFYTRIFILGFVLLFIINRMFFIGEKNSKTSNIIFSIVIILFTIFSINTGINFNKYKILYDYDRYVNYGIRNIKKNVYRYDSPASFEKDLYSRLYLVDNFRKIPIYYEKNISEDVEFLGRDGNNFYFQEDDHITYRELGDYLEVVDNLQKPIREGIRFYLKDQRFKDIGFKEKSINPYLLNYKIPESMKNKKFENPKNVEIVRQKEFTSGWINPASSNTLSWSKEKENE